MLDTNKIIGDIWGSKGKDDGSLLGSKMTLNDEKCQHKVSNMEFEKIIEVVGSKEITALFKEKCSKCHKELGEETQVFKYHRTKK